MSGGDITKRDAIMWGYTLSECEPYIKHREREALNRELLIAFIKGWAGELDDDDTSGNPEGFVTKKQKRDYCNACKQMGKTNCDGCEYGK